MIERLRHYSLQVVAVIVLFAVAVGAGYVTKGTDTNRSPVDEPSAASGARGSIQSVNGNTLTLVTEAGAKQYTLAANATVEVIRPTTAATIATGEWLNAGAIKNGQTMFAIVGLTLIPQALLQAR